MKIWSPADIDRPWLSLSPEDVEAINGLLSILQESNKIQINSIEGFCLFRKGFFWFVQDSLGGCLTNDGSMFVYETDSIGSPNICGFSSAAQARESYRAYWNRQWKVAVRKGDKRWYKMWDDKPERAREAFDAASRDNNDAVALITPSGEVEAGEV